MSELDATIHRLLAAEPSDGPLDGDRAVAMVRELDPLRPAAEVERTVSAVLARANGLGPVHDLLAEDGITDIMINGPGAVWVERDGLLEQTGIVLDLAQIELLVERIVAPLGRRVDPVHAMADGRLGDGSRVHVVVPPLAVDGPCITIRRFASRGVPLADMASPELLPLLVRAVQGRSNIVISGATSSGKTTLLNALAREVGMAERVITVEDAAELRLETPHVVRLESRVATADGVAEVTIRSLVRAALRMRPDRLIVGEVRGGEALDLLSAMSTGHDGSMSTVHANSAVEAMARLETLVLMANMGLPLEAVRAQLLSAVDLVIHVARVSGGGRSVIEVVRPRPEADDSGHHVEPVWQRP